MLLLIPPQRTPSKVNQPTTAPDPVHYLSLNCLVLPVNGEPNWLTVKILRTENISTLQALIKQEQSPGLNHVIASKLILSQVSLPLGSDLRESLKSLDLAPLDPFLPLSQVFSRVEEDRLHIVVQEPTNEGLSTKDAGEEETRDQIPALHKNIPTDDHLAKRRRLLNQTPRTPSPKGKAAIVTSPTRLTDAQTVTAMEEAIKPFEEYLVDLANGKLDRYLDSLEPEGKEAYVGIGLPLAPKLLLHRLGTDKGQDERIKELFQDGITQLFAVSGSGKTRLSLEGLCKNWGIYLSCRAGLGTASGANDIKEANAAFVSMTATNCLDSSSKPNDRQRNILAARRAYSQLLCARVFVLKTLLEKIPFGTTADSARRRWVLLQILPPFIQEDLFVTVLRAIRGGVTDILQNITSTMLNGLAKKCPNLFPRPTGLFAVVDEAQEAVKHLQSYFRSDNDLDSRPILREIVGSLEISGIFSGVILSGTGLSLPAVQRALSSSSAKSGRRRHTFINTGCFTKASQEVYIKSYLTLSDSPSDQRLLERIQHWLIGRYRLTASFMELLAFRKNIPHHRALTSFVKQITGFTLTDAMNLECDEPDLPDEVSSLIETYQPITMTDQLFSRQDDELIQTLHRIIMRWMLGSRPTTGIANYMHQVIALGIGSSMKQAGEDFDSEANYPVYIDEPLVVLDICRHFEKHARTTRKSWIAIAFSDALNPSSQGFVFEQIVLFTLVEVFGMEARRLDDAFITDQPWGSRMVRLVSLNRAADNELRACNVSWNTGSSDCLGFQANDPKDVLNFLDNPRGKAFLFPDNHMGPDLLCFFRDEETQELIIVVIQAKLASKLHTGRWLSAIKSIDQSKLYTSRKQEDGKLHPHAPKSFPTLHRDIADAVEKILGEATSAPEVVNAYRTRLRSHKLIDQRPAPRQSPRFLRVIATPQDDPELLHRLKAEWTSDLTALRWRSVEGYLGVAANAAKMRLRSVLS